MKAWVVLLAILGAPFLNAETRVTREEAIQKVCQAPEITSGPEFNVWKHVQQRLALVVSQDKEHVIHIALLKSDVLNAWSTNLTMKESLICIPAVMVSFMGSEGEFAFLVSHEIGHAVDDACKTLPRTGRLASVRRRSRLNVLLGGNRVAAQRKCEARADAIGFNIFRAAGYNPFDAAGAFGRMEMYVGDTSTGILARLNSVRSDHPMTPDRIKHMRSLLLAEENAQTPVSETPK